MVWSLDIFGAVLHRVLDRADALELISTICFKISQLLYFESYTVFRANPLQRLKHCLLIFKIKEFGDLRMKQWSHSLHLCGLLEKKPLWKPPYVFKGAASF